ncbi:uncharacterized protein HD556DRAFT_1345469 [Suillus plorans]|uniref:Uncharacterized protein n=1 Tax=Suillus plorans TaxID=116603 RepID=A0A9P7DPN9_9AGAM|nr:uncharacterized protein HD556DRAFT_1345469 [Suillus plorans]KAG1799860.1 hypothetical protein HD556DRAFT_1345469 [Suillus plorans]
MRFTFAIILAVAAASASSIFATPIIGTSTDKCSTWCWDNGACRGCIAELSFLQSEVSSIASRIKPNFTTNPRYRLLRPKA